MNVTSHHRDLTMDWIRKNVWVLIVTAAGIVSSYAVYGYKVSDLQNQVDFTRQQVTLLQNSNTEQLVTLAQIQKDIEYMKLQLTQISQDLKN